MIIVVDECVPRRYLNLLQEWGHQAEAASAHIPADAVDDDVLDLARKLDGGLLTVDLDFANILDYPPAGHNGIIVMRYEARLEEGLDATLKSVFSDLDRESLRKVLVIVAEGRYRVRR